MRNKPKARISSVADGTWTLYSGTRKVKSGMDLETARAALRDVVSPRQSYGELVNPVTGEAAPADQMWVQSVMGGWVTISDRTPYTLSPSSETYWSS